MSPIRRCGAVAPSSLLIRQFEDSSTDELAQTMRANNKLQEAVAGLLPVAEVLESRVLLSGAHPLASPDHGASPFAPRNVVVIDSNLSDSGLLIGAASAGDKVFTYNGATESPNAVLSSVSAWARSARVQIRSLSLLSHGKPGAFELGSAWESEQSLRNSSRSWKQLGAVLAPSAVIDLYACDLAAPGGQGQDLLNQIARLTGATVFASTNLTGKGGDWNLEAQSQNAGHPSKPGTADAFDLQKLSAYPDTLATITVATAAAASPSPVTAKTTALSVLGASTAGESTLLYTWSATTSPGTVTYSDNGTNTAKNATATFSKAGAYVFKCTISDSLGSTSTTSTVSATVSQTFTTITLTDTAAAIHENLTKTLTCKGYDQFGVIMSTEPTWTWSMVSGAGSVASVNSTSGRFTAGGVAGTSVCKASSGAISATVSVSVTNASPTVATAAAITPKPATGTTATLSVLGADDNTEPNLTYTWAATVKPTGSNPTFSANGTNASKNCTVTFNLSGSYTFVATISDGQGGTVTSTVTETVNQTLASIVVTPGTATLSRGNTQQFTARGYDQFGTLMASQPTFTWSVNGSGVGGAVSASGLYTAPAAASGTDVVKATSGAVSGTAAVTVQVGAQPASATPSTVTGTTTALSALAAGDAGQSTLTYTWSAIGSPPAPVSFSVNGTNAAKNTVATFSQSGSYTLQVSIFDGTNTITSSTTVTVNQTLTMATVLPTVVNLNLNQTQTFSVASVDQFGNPMATAPTYVWSIDNGSVGTLNTSTLVYSSGTAAGTATVRATSGSVGDSTVVTVTDAPPTVASAAAASPATVAGQTTALSVLGADDGGESNLTYTWATTGSPPAPVTFSDSGDNAAKNVTATFTAAGTYSFQVTITDASGNTATSSVDVFVSQTVTSISVAPGTASLGAAGTQAFSATAYDQFGTALSAQPTFSWSATSGAINQSGTYTAPQISATPTITASNGGISGTANVTVTNAAPTVATAANATPATITGKTTALSVLGADDGGESNLTYTWATTGSPPAAVTFSANGTNAAKNATATFTKAGTYSFQVTLTDAGGLTTTSSVSVTVNQTLTTITVLPASISLNENQIQQFTAAGYDQFANLMVSQPTFTWAKASGVGAINSSGLYTAPYGTGSASVTATSGAVSGSASITVSNATPTVATPASASTSPVTGTTTALSVLGSDDGGESNLTYTWATTGSPPAAVTFSANGTNAAKSSTATFTNAGAYSFQVTITDASGLSTTSSVSVTVNQTLTTITVSPATASLNENATQDFSATAYDQFGTAMASQPTLTWSKAGVGSINSSTGVLTSGAIAGSSAVTATSGAISGTAAITVTNASPTVATAASASPSLVTGATSSLSVLGADDNGEANLTYAWAATAKPSGSNPVFSANGTNAAKNSTVTFNQSGNYTFTVIISDGQGGTTNSSVNVTVNQTLSAVIVSPATASLSENATQSFSATAYDQFGITMATQPTLTWAKASGVGSINASGLYTAPYGTGSASVTAASGSISGSASITVNNATPTVATAASASPSPVTGTTTALSVLGADDGGESNLTYTWATTGSPPAAVTFSANGTNAAKNSTASFTKAGAYSFQVTITDAGGLSTASSVTVQVNQTLTTITVSPATASLNENASQNFSATGYDQFGSAMVSQPMLTWAKASGVGSINVSGLYTAPYGTGSASVSATSGAVSGSASITVSNSSPTVATPASASPSPVTGTTTALTAFGADDGGESNLTYTWATTGTPPAAVTFSANGTNAAKNSTATFTKAGTYSFQVTITDASGLSTTSSVSVTVDQTLTTIAVSPATASLNENATQTFSATGYDQFGSAMASQPTFTWAKASGVGTINSSGLYTAPYGTGSASVTATSGAVSASATITVSNATPTVATSASPSPSPVTGTTTALSVLGADDGGESNLTYTWAATAAPSGAVPSLSINGTNAAKNSTVTFSQSGNYTFTVTISDGQGASTNSSVSVTVNQTLTTITVSPASNSLNENQSQQFTAAGYDQFANLMASQPPFIWAKASGVGSVNASGLYTAPYGIGSASLTAASGAISGSASITVSNATPTVATSAFASPSPVTGTTAALNVLGADDGGESNLTYTWAATAEPTGSSPTFSANGTNAAKNSTVTFNQSGNYIFTVTISDGQGGTTNSSVNVTVNQTLTTITVLPASNSLNENQSQQFTATGYDQFGIAMITQPTFTWAKASGVGAINSLGLYTAPYGTGSASITAASGAVSGSASITVSNATPTVATSASASPSPVTGTTTALSVLGADDGGESNLTYTWATTGSPPAAVTFSANGTNAAKSSTATFTKAGAYSFQVTITDASGLSTTSSVSVTVNQTLTTIAVLPASTSLNENQTQQFAATAYDQFGMAMASQPTFTWAKVSGVGSISASGLYSAPYGTGFASVTAASGSISGSASVTISNATATVATLASASPSPVTGTTTALSVLGADDGGESNLTYTWAATAGPTGAASTFSANGTNAAKNSTVTFNQSGDYTFTVTISDGQGATTNSSVNVTVNQTLSTITVSPATASLNENATQGFSAIAYDQFSIAMATQPTFTWAKASGVGLIDAAGLYTAPYGTGSASITATSGAVFGSASVTIGNATPTVATLASASPSPVAGTVTTLSVLGADDGGEANLNYAWATTGTPPAAVSFSANGNNAAQNSIATFTKAGSYDFQVAITDAGGLSTTSSVTVQVNQILTTIAVSPATASLNENATQIFTATGYDQFGIAMASQPTFAWTNTGVGNIDSGTGVYTSPASAGTANVTATSGAVSGSSAVVVTNAPPTVAAPASAAPSPVTGVGTSLSVLGADDNGESNLTYAWTATGEPAGANPLFDINGINTAKNTNVTFDMAGDYAFTVLISDGQGGTTSSSVNVTVDQTLTTIAVSPASTSLNENQTQQFTAVGYDQFANLMVSQPTLTWAKASGVGSINASGLYTAPYGTGSANVTATNGAVSGSASITVSNATPTVATPASVSPSPVSGTTTALSVLGADDGGESNLTYTWAATAEPTGAAPTFSGNGTNAAKNSTATFDKAGEYTFTVTISDGQGGTTNSSVNVIVNQTLTAITVSPATTTLNEDAAQAFSAVGYDQFGSVMAAQPAFAWTNSGVGSIDSTTGMYAAPGVAGTAAITATSAGIDGSANVTVTNAAPTVALAASASPSPASGTTARLSVIGADDNGESNLTYTWTTTTEPAGATALFSANGSNIAKSSTVTFDAAGDYTFSVTISDGQGGTATSSVNVTVTQTLTSLVVTPASKTLSENSSQMFTAVAYDQFGTSLSNQPTFAWTNTGIGSIDSTTGMFIAPGISGVATITATSGAISDSASVNVTNAAPTVATTAAASPSAINGAMTALSVLGADDNGEGNLVYTWLDTAEPTGANPLFSANGSNAAKNSIVTFDEAGDYAFAVTISDRQGGTTTSSVNVTVDQTLTSIVVSPASKTLTENGSQPFNATGYDQFGAAMLTQPIFGWTNIGLGTIDGSTGMYTASGAAGSATVTATSGSVAGSASLTVTNAAPTIATAASASPSPVTGATTALSVLGADDNGESNLTYTWAATTEPAGASPLYSINGTNAAKNSTVTFDEAGDYTFAVTISDGQGGTGTSSVNVSVGQTLTTIVVTPASRTLNENTTQTFAALGLDQFGTVVNIQPGFTWTNTGIGSIDSHTGTYTASGVAGNATVTATSGMISGSASLTIRNAAPTITSVASASPSPITGTTTALSVLGADDNGESNLTYTWAATTRPVAADPVFTANGTNAAKNNAVTFDKAGDYTLAVTISDGQGGITTSSVNVSVNQTLTSVVVSPSTQTLNEDATRTFNAVGYDQFGSVMAAQPAFAWTNSGVGSIDSTAGTYAAPGVAGTAIVTATSAGINGSANVTITNAAPTVLVAASASPSPTSGTTAMLSVIGADDNGESNLTYSWAATTEPPGANPLFSVNGNNAAKNSVVTFDEAGNYTLAVTITDGQGGTIASGVNVSVDQTLMTIIVNPISPSLHENQTQQFSATGCDQFGSLMATQPAFTWTNAGIGSIDSTAGVYTAPGASGNSTITATSGSIAGSASVDVSNAAPTVAAAASASPSRVTGLATTLSALGADDAGESNLAYTWTATAEPTGANPLYSINDTNAAKNSNVTFDEAGDYTFTVTISDGQGGTTNSSVNVTVDQTLTSIVVSPATKAIHEDASQTFAAIGYDQFDAAMNAQPAFNWTNTGVGSIDSGTGAYTAPGAAGGATVTASSGSVTGFASVNVTNAAPTIASAASASLSPITGATTTLSVLGADDNGESNLAYTWAATTGPVGANPLFSVNGTNAAKNNTATFDEAGDYTFTVTISDGQGGAVTSSVSVTVNQTLTSIVVTPANKTLNENDSQLFTAVGYDQFGTIMAAQPAFTWANTGIGSIDSGTGEYTAPGAAGSATITATNGSITNSASVTITNALPSVATPASASPPLVTSTTTALSALGADDNGEFNLTYTWAATTEPAGANPLYSINATNTAKNSTVTFDEAGNYIFTVTISDGQGGTATSSVDVSVGQTLTSIVVTPATKTLNEDASQTFTATGYDQFGSVMAAQPAFIWTNTGIGSVIGATGMYTASGDAGTATVTATSGSIANSASVTITNAAPTIASAASASPSPASGITTMLSVLGADDNAESNLTYTWVAAAEPVGANPLFTVNGTNAAKNSTVTFDEAGIYTFTVTISDGQGGTTTSSVNVSVGQTLTSVVVTPATKTLNESGSQTFTAVGYDQFGTAMNAQPAFTWTASGIGSIDSATGMFIAPGISGVATITATSGAISASASVNVTNAAPSVATTAAASPSAINGAMTALSVLGADDNGEGNLVYTWLDTAEPTGANPLFSANGSNAAKNSTVTFDEAGDYIFAVTISDGQGEAVTSSVNVTVDQTLTSIVVAPATETLNEDASQNFTATGFDQFGSAMATQPAFAWTNTGIGSIDSTTGVYIAPGAAGTATITATGAAIAGSSRVTISNASPTLVTAASASPSPVTGSTLMLSVLGADDNGEGNLTYDWTASAAPAAASPTFSNNSSNAARDSTVTLNEAGTYTFTVTISDGQGGTTTSSVSVAVEQTLTRIVVTPATKTLNENASQTFTASGYDQFGTPMNAPPTFNWTNTGIGLIDSATGTYIAPGAAGSATITASSGSVTGSASVAVTNAAPTITIAASVSPSSVTGTTTTLSALGADDNGESNLTYSWTATAEPIGANPLFGVNANNTAKSSTVTFDEAGNYTFTVAISDGQGRTAFSSVNVAVDQSLTSILVTPASTTLTEDASRAFTALNYDQFGTVMNARPAFAWTVVGIGSINPATGAYAAPGAAGNATIVATSASITGTASVTITNARPTISTPAAASPFPITGATTTLSVLGADDNGERNLTYTWTATAEPAGANPVLSVNGTNAAKNSAVTFDEAGNYTFTVTISDQQGGSVSSSVNVTVNQTLTTIHVTPTNIHIAENSTQLFFATGYDQFGAVLADVPSLDWSSSGPGSISASGLFAASTTPGTTTITAAVGSVFGSATVTTYGSPPTLASSATASISSDTTALLSVLGADVAGENVLTYDWSTTLMPTGATPVFAANDSNAAKNNVVTFDEAGRYQFTVTVTDAQQQSTTSSVTVDVAQQLKTLEISPAVAVINENAAQVLTATGLDQFMHVMSDQPPIVWSVPNQQGTIDMTGRYTAPAIPGTYRATASSGSVTSTATITVNSAAPVIVQPAATSSLIAGGNTLGLSVIASADGGANVVYSWTTIVQPRGSRAPSFDVNNSNAASNTNATFFAPGTYTVLVTASNGTLSTSSSITVRVHQIFSQMLVASGSRAIAPEILQKLASGYEQFAVASTDLAPAPASTQLVELIASVPPVPAALSSSSTLQASAGATTVAASSNTSAVAASSAAGSVASTDEDVLPGRAVSPNAPHTVALPKVPVRAAAPEHVVPPSNNAVPTTPKMTAFSASIVSGSVDGAASREIVRAAPAKVDAALRPKNVGAFLSQFVTNAAGFSASIGAATLAAKLFAGMTHGGANISKNPRFKP